jgi:transposase
LIYLRFSEPQSRTASQPSTPALRPRFFHDVVERLNEVPGLGATAVETVIAEIGIDMSQFPSAGHLLSWAGFVPGLDESAGKRRSTRIKKGAPGSGMNFNARRLYNSVAPWVEGHH